MRGSEEKANTEQEEKIWVGGEEWAENEPVPLLSCIVAAGRIAKRPGRDRDELTRQR